MADQRFSALSKDPRYRLPSRKQAQTAVDPRFKTLFTDQDFHRKASVDRYGRKVKPDSSQKDIEKRFRLEEDDDEAEDGKAAGKGLKNVVASSDEEDEEEDDEEEASALRDPAREGGFSESSSEEEDTSDEESDDEEEMELAEETAGREQTEVIPMGDVTKRIAAVNLDWDHIRAIDLMAVASSFAPTGGRVESVVIYPSEFGRERLEREELEGPPREIFASSRRSRDSEEAADSDEDEDDDEKIKKRLLSEQANEGEEFDTAKLREYQLERLRYYYAVITCDDDSTAKMLYDNMDGREYLTTANFFDLRFIPDETSFEEDRPRDECRKLPDSYKPNEFRTEALTHSKVRLTWDDDDTTRKEVQKRAFSRAEMDENDLQAYIGSDESDADSTTSRKSAAEDKKAKKREDQRAKMRAALGLAAESTKSGTRGGKEEAVGDMQITFSAGLSSNKEGKGVFENEPQDEESTRDRYIRKERERKQKRKEKMKAERVGGDGDAEAEEDAIAGEEQNGAAADKEEDDPFNDPFFNDPAASALAEKEAKKAERRKKREAKEAEQEAAASRKAELELLLADDQQDNLRHFDMKEIEKAEKAARKKGKGSKKGKKGDSAPAVEGPQGDEFKVETEDPRFKALFDSHEYAIDPTNPRFKGTDGMKAILEEGRKKRKRGDDAVDGEKGEEQQSSKTKSKKTKAANGSAVGGDDELKGLVARLKGKGGRK